MMSGRLSNGGAGDAAMEGLIFLLAMNGANSLVEGCSITLYWGQWNLDAFL